MAAPCTLLPHEILLMIARGETIGGHVPSFAERVDAAKQILPYYVPKRTPEPVKQENEGLIVTLVRHADQSDSEARPFLGLPAPIGMRQ